MSGWRQRLYRDGHVCCPTYPLWCLIDNVNHDHFGMRFKWVCDRHDRAVAREYPDDVSTEVGA